MGCASSYTWGYGAPIHDQKYMSFTGVIILLMGAIAPYITGDEAHFVDILGFLPPFLKVGYFLG